MKHNLDCKCPFCKNKRGETFGENHPLWGTRRSDSAKQKISETKQGIEQSKEQEYFTSINIGLNVQ